MKKLIVIGNKRHGKDTMCEYLSEVYNFSFESSSMFACNNFIFDTLKDKYNYTSPEECYKDRDNHRSEWFNLISEFNTPNKARLAFDIFENNDIYCGLRCKVELDTIKNQTDVLVVWVDRSNVLPLEDSSSMTVTREDADFIIDNNGTEEEFKKEIDKFVKIISFYNDITTDNFIKMVNEVGVEALDEFTKKELFELLKCIILKIEDCRKEFTKLNIFYNLCIKGIFKK